VKGDIMQINRNMPIQPIIRDVNASQPVNAAQTAAASSDFRQLMENAISQKKELQFSKHANMRLNSRDIVLDDAQMARLEEGVTRAQSKGIRDSLVLIDNIALVVNIQNKVVVTAINGQEQTITNIDGAVIV